MARISFKKKPRKSEGLYEGNKGRILTATDWVRQNEIHDAKMKTRARACFRECQTCGTCKNSQRDGSYPYQYDAHEAKNINCITCEPHRFHDCHNGFMRDSHGEAEPFTEEHLKLIEMAVDKKPLM